MIHTNKIIIRTDKVTHRILQLLCIAGVTLFCALLTTSCVKDELYNTPHPESGAVTITTDWSELSPDASRPEGYLLRIGNATQYVNGTENTFKELLPAGTYSLLVQNMPNGIIIGTTIATVNTLANGTLEPMPDYLFSAIQELNLQNDDTLKVRVKMIQSIRQLTLVLQLKDGDAARIQSTNASLTGIAGTIDLATGLPIIGQEGMTTVQTFEKATVARSTVANALIGTLHLAGVVASEHQLLHITVTMMDGNQATIESDLTEALKNFATDHSPLTLDAELPLPDEEQTEGSFNATIDKWEEVDNGDITIH